jgi:3-deoxy-D-manno-octulosonic-acid transferase
MYVLYGLLYALGFILMLPVFAVSALLRTKHAAGFYQRLGFLPKFMPDKRAVVWLHCVSVGETNAARPLVDALKEAYPENRIIVSTVTRTGQKLAREIFRHKADCVFYVPFDFRWTVRRALRHFEPQVLLLMETELWFNLIRETNKTKARIAIVNGRLSQRSLDRYTKIKKFMKRILGYLDMALMQENADATRIMALGLRASKVRVLGNLKFDHELNEGEHALTTELRDRFGITGDEPLIIAASTHSPEEKWVLEAFKQVWKTSMGNLPRLMIVPRHPERFGDVADQIKASGFSWVRRSEQPSSRDNTAEVILLDTVGELRATYPLAEIVFVGGSLIPHGGQSIYEPASAGKAIVTGPHTANFEVAVKGFAAKDALIQLEETAEDLIPASIASIFQQLLADPEKRRAMGQNAAGIMKENRGTTARTVEHLEPLLRPAHLRTGLRR